MVFWHEFYFIASKHDGWLTDNKTYFGISRPHEPHWIKQATYSFKNQSDKFFLILNPDMYAYLQKKTSNSLKFLYSRE